MILKGIFAASVSVLNEDLSLNVNQTRLHAESLIKKGCHGVALLGSTGQAQLLTIEEKKKLIDNVEQSAFKKNFLIGTGLTSLGQNVDFMKHCVACGFHNFLLMNPPYYKYSDEGTFAFFSEIINRIPESKIILYNFEKLSGYVFSIKLIEKMVKEFPEQIVGCKDSTYNLYENLKIPNFSIFLGSETKLLKGLKIGCSGIISAVSNVCSQLARKVYDDFINNKKQTLNERLCSLRKVFDNYNLISAIHSFMSLEDEKYKKVLPPLSLLSDAEQQALVNKLKEIEFYPEIKAA